MGWFSRSKQNPPAAVEKEDIWSKCPSCTAHVFKEEWEKNFKVCPKCNFHERLTAQERVRILLDENKFHEIGDEVTTSDPLKFSVDKESYAEKAEGAKSKTGLKEAVFAVRGKLSGMPVVLAVMDFRFLGGSLSSGAGERILRASEYALRHKMPLIIFSASGGARMHEGIVSLMQMARTCAGISRLNQGRVPYISVMTDPTTGGVSASFAMVGDLNIAEPGALIGFAGRRVIEETIKQKLPDNFQKAEYLLEHGFVDCIVSRKDMKDFLFRVLQYWKK
jgi:acetyl-CoA carboxylase carboxyl transferase subunit beta